MARAIIDIQNEVYAKIAADPILPNSISNSSIYRRFTFIICYIIWVVESLFDTHNQEINAIIEAKFPHRTSWYKTKSLAFQYGFDLIRDTDKYDNTGFTDEEIEASKVIKYSAVTKSGGQLRIKIATETAGVLTPIAPEVKTAFDAYIEDVADAGVNYLVVNLLPDILLLNMQIFINPLVLDANGMSILNGNYPVQDAINEFMKELPFNGELVLFDLETKIKAAEGVVIPNIINAESQAIDINTNQYQDAEPINVKTIPVSGYFKIPNFDNVNYVV